MARRLDSFPPQTRSRYPWDEWLDGSAWELVHGEDFHSRMTTLRANAQLQAKKRGGQTRSKVVRTDDGHEAVVIQFQRE
jgi:hypothetical protein